jgi:hypothetical protein
MCLCVYGFHGPNIVYLQLFFLQHKILCVMEPGISIVFCLQQTKGEHKMGEGGPIRVDGTIGNGAENFNLQFVFDLLFCGGRAIDPYRRGVRTGLW